MPIPYSHELFFLQWRPETEDHHRTQIPQFLMEQSRENWPLDIAEVGDDKDLVEQCHSATDDEEFLRDILQQPAATSESESQSFVVGGAATADGSSLSSNEMAGSGKRLRSSSSPRTYILSFDNSTIIPATPEQPYLDSNQRLGTRSSKSNSPLSSKIRTLENPNLEPKLIRATQGGKKTRSDSQTLDHITAERKRRQELTQKFLALSAIIPGLKKTDKGSILGEAISYVKLLQQRVTELEERNKRGKESTIILKKTDLCANEDEDTTSSETSSEDCLELLPDVEARVLENEVLIEINCEKENGIQLKILDLLENLHLYVTSSSVLPFGNSTLGITIIAQMGDAYSMTVNDLVKTLRRVLLNE